jgi:hypothetical protein
MKTLPTLCTLGLCIATATAMLPATASTRDPLVNHRQFHHAERIDQGMASGALTRGETARLATEQRAIRAEERYYKRDGVLTRFERADLRHDLASASRDIRWQKHDRERSFY